MLCFSGDRCEQPWKSNSSVHREKIQTPMFKFTTWTFPLSSLFSVFCSVTEGRTLLSFLQMLSPLRTRGNGFRLKEGGLDWIKGKSYLWEGQCSSGTGCPEMRWVPHPCRHSGQAGGLWALMELWVSLRTARGLEIDDLKGPFQLKPFYDSKIISYLPVTDVAPECCSPHKYSSGEN